MYADDVIVADELAHRVADLLALLSAQELIAHGRVGSLLLDIVLIQIQQNRQIFRQKVDVHMVLLQLQRIQKNILHAGRGGKDLHVAVIHRPA